MDGQPRPMAPQLDSFVASPPGWCGSGPSGEVVLSSRVRLARNLASVPFPTLAKPQEQKLVMNRLHTAAANVAPLEGAQFLEFEDFGPLDLNLLIERRLISRDLAAGRRQRGVVVGRREAVSVMINEEDHLRLQAMVSGLRLGEAFERVNGLDDALDVHLDYAFSRKLGYLTACPTNTGTGMRASVLAHLPALVLTRRARKVLQGASAMGLDVRGFYGEGTEVRGNFIQISNRTTLGGDENGIVSRLDEVVRRILREEKDAREEMWLTARVQLEDKIFRAYGTLRHARSLSADEVLSLASAVRLGLALEMGELCPLSVLNEIVVFSQPGHVTRMAGRELTQEERRARRADYVRGRIGRAEGEPNGPGEGISGNDHPVDPAD